MSGNKSKLSQEEIRSQLPEHLRQEYDMLVSDYRFAAHVRYGKRFVSYMVLADLIRAGWRRSVDSIEVTPNEQE